jgi:hypothetical protein
VADQTAPLPLDVAALGEVQVVPIGRIRPYPGNARRIPAKAVEQCAKSLTEFGWQQPIVVDAEFVIIAGHVRRLGALELHLATVPVVVARDLTPEQVRAYRIADNRTHDYTTWDYGQLAAELGELEDFADVLDLADWQGIVAQLAAAQAEPDLIDPELAALLTGQFAVTVIFGSQDEADRAGELIFKTVPGVINVRYARRRAAGGPAGSD